MIKQLSLTLNPGPVGGQYSPGSTLSGSLSVELEVPQKFQAITVTVTGEGHVQWTERRTSASGDSTHYYTVEGRETYINMYQVLWRCEESPDGVLPVGVHTYPFQMMLPATCPASYRSELGNISYEIVGKIATGVPSLEYRASQPFNVVEVITFPPGVGEQPVRFESRKKVKTGLFKSGDIVFKMELPKTRFCVGEDILVNWSVENGSGKKVNPLFSVEETVTYFAIRDNYTRLVKYSIATQGSTPIPPHSASGDMSIRIPLSACRPAMTRSNLIRNNITLTMSVLIPGMFVSNAALSTPLYISNVSMSQPAVPAVPMPQPGVPMPQPAVPVASNVAMPQPYQQYPKK